MDPATDRFADAANLLKGAGGVFMALAQVRPWMDRSDTNPLTHPSKRPGDAVVVLSDVSPPSPIPHGPNHTRQDFLPRWKETPENAASRHPETSEGVAMAFIDLASAQAQMMYVAKGLFAGNVPKGTLAKLSVAVTERMDKCASNFRARAAPHFARLDPDFLLYLTFVP